MTQKEIEWKIGKAIREAKYLRIEYKNLKEETTQFWISIQDIHADGKIDVVGFNVTKTEPISTKLSISRIQTAEIMRFTYYEVSPALRNKIETDESLKVFEFDRYNTRYLNYYLECYKANQDPFLYKSHLIPGLDLEQFNKENTYDLDESQFNKVIKDIYHKDYDKYQEYELGICDFSIDINNKGKYVVAYRKLKFDPVTRKLHIQPKPSFNPHFFFGQEKHTLAYYCDISPADFEKQYASNKQELLGMLADSFKKGEIVNTRPEIVVLGFKQTDISEVYDSIHQDIKSGKVELPMSAFFQQLSLLDRANRKEPHIVLYDKNVNIDQVNTVYNTLKYPITYVQGPPGTGKTQTILNIIVNCIINKKTVLVTSNNNTPIDGIYEKLHLGEYKGNPILLPILRLGNNDYTWEALNLIKKRFEIESRDTPKENLLEALKEKSKLRNKQLLEKLKTHDDRRKILLNIDFIKSLLTAGGNYLLEKELRLNEEKLAASKEIVDNDLKNLYETVEGNSQMLQFFYFECLKFQKRLLKGAFEDLEEILAIEEKEEQVRKFNRWIGIDTNMERLSKVFPIILTTNLSSRKLGKEFKFDLLVMDEAGQCDVATSLIPISKCKTMVMIGDTNQLKPIVVFEESKNDLLMQQYGIDNEYNYYTNSILSVYRQIDNISTDILLRYHYRCGRKIIDYSNQRFYGNKLNLDKIQRPGNIKLLDVKNSNEHKRNANHEEAAEIVKYIKENNLKDVFVITPFRNQQEVLNIALERAKSAGEVDASVDCGTIHKIQGRENKTIILSTSISKKTTPHTYNWIKNNNELINVGVTRAKENLIVVADAGAIDILSNKTDDLYALIEYMKKNGETKVVASDSRRFTIGFSNNSSFEDEFYKTMNHYCSIQGVRYERNVKVVRVFPEELYNNDVNKKEFDGVLYEGRVPKVIFEINGKEHYKNKRTMTSDSIKMELVKSKNMKLLLVPNNYVKHYEFISNLVIKLSGGVYQQDLFE